MSLVGPKRRKASFRFGSESGLFGKIPGEPRKIVELLTGPERDAREARAQPQRRTDLRPDTLVGENRPSSRVVSGGIGHAAAAVSGAARGTGKTRPAGLGKILSKSGALAGGYFGDRVNLANRVSGYDRLVLGVPFSRHLRAAAFHSGLPVRYHCGKL